MLNRINNFLFKKVSIAALVLFRILFGSLLLYSTVRTIQKGWIDELYIQPEYNFGFFSWLTPLDETGMYAVFILLAVCALGIILGLFYRISVSLFGVLFIYVELLDKTYYLNHYYLVSLLVFWLALAPAHRYYSIDTLIFPKIKSTTCSNWYILIFKVQLSIVYFFAGVAKLNPDWILRAQPMATWLPGKYDVPIIGQWVHLKEVAFVLSWLGCLYDLTIWIFLLIKRSRFLAYITVIVFHILTVILFPRIGMFPYIMIVSAVIFFSASTHKKILSYLPFSKPLYPNSYSSVSNKNSLVSILLMCYLVVQLYLPARNLWYSGNLFWNEEGYRFSWRVMLMEKNGYTSIIVRDPIKNEQREINQCDYLTAFQQQQMKSQPGMILQFVQHIGDEFKDKNGYAPEVFVKSRMSLNGRRSQPFINDSIDVYLPSNSEISQWIIPFQE